MTVITAGNLPPGIKRIKEEGNFITHYLTDGSKVSSQKTPVFDEYIWGKAGSIPEQDPFFDAQALEQQRLKVKMDNLKKLKEFEMLIDRVKESFETIKPKQK